MQTYKSFLGESIKGGIQHLEHASDKTFDGKEAAHHAVKTLHGALSGKGKITRKIDDRMSYHAIRDKHGRVGVKYKGAGSHYNFSHKDIETQHGHKPYLVGPLKALHSHLHKVLPRQEGEYQGGYMSTPETRHEEGGKIHHTPNTITYSHHADSDEGKKLKKSKVSTVIHTELKGPHREAHPIHDVSHFGTHNDVHMVSHIVHDKEREIPDEHKKAAKEHIKKAVHLMKDHSYHHLAGHEAHLRTYVNSKVTSGEKPSLKGLYNHVSAKHDKKIADVKSDKAKAAKTATKHADLAHIKKNAKHFARSLLIHHHIQAASNHIARGLDKASHAHSSTETSIEGKHSGGEGYVSNNVKIVDREGFAKANRERSERFKKSKVNEETEHEKTAVFAYGRYSPPTIGHEKVFDKTSEVAKNYGVNPHIITSHSHDNKRNPLHSRDKVSLIKKAYPHAKVLSTSKKHPTLIHIAKHFHKTGHKHLVMVAGSDRVKEMQDTLDKYNGKEYHFKSIKVVSAGHRDPDSDDASGMSGTKLRHHAINGHAKKFMGGLMSKLSDEDKKDTYEKVRSSLSK